MSNVPMTVQGFINVAKTLPSNISILLRGETGIGKSQITHQLGRFFSLPIIDKRLSQLSDGDMIGLPSIAGEATRFNPPDWYMKACKEPVMLFLDELNRATQEVMQAAFQIVLDRELSGHKLHENTRVYSAVNTGAKFTINEMDPALLRRFFVCDLEPTLEDWIKWAQDTGEWGGNIDDTIIEFHRMTQGKHLDPVHNAEPGSVQPTRHSWERFDKSAKYANNMLERPGDPTLYTMLQGFVGVEPATAFIDYAKSQDVLLTGEDVLDRYPEVAKKIKKMTVDKLNGVIDRVGSYILDEKKQLPDPQGVNLGLFCDDLNHELRIVLWTKLVSQGITDIDLARQIHKYMNRQILEVFGTVPGDAGVGMVPNIPASLQNK